MIVINNLRSFYFNEKFRDLEDKDPNFKEIVRGKIDLQAEPIAYTYQRKELLFSSMDKLLAFTSKSPIIKCLRVRIYFDLYHFFLAHNRETLEPSIESTIILGNWTIRNCNLVPFENTTNDKFNLSTRFYNSQNFAPCLEAPSGIIYTIDLEKARIILSKLNFFEETQPYSLPEIAYQLAWWHTEYGLSDDFDMEDLDSWEKEIVEAVKKGKPNATIKKKTANTETTIEASSQENLLGEMSTMIGLDNVKEDIRGLASFAKIRKLKIEKGIKVTPSTLHLVFSGNPGTGKTTVARLIGKLYKEIGLLKSGHVVETSRNELVGQYIGHTAPQVTEVFNKSIDGVLFIDEAYTLTSKDGKDFGREAVETLLTLMENHREKVVVIVAGYPDKMNEFLQSNPGLNSRFGAFLNFDDYSPEQLVSIFLKMLSDNDHRISEEALTKLTQVVEDGHKAGKFVGNARDVRNLLDKVLRNQSRRLDNSGVSDSDDLSEIVEADIEGVSLTDAIN